MFGFFDFFYYLEITNCTGKHAGWVPEHIIIKENNSIIGANETTAIIFKIVCNNTKESSVINLNLNL